MTLAEHSPGAAAPDTEEQTPTAQRATGRAARRARRAAVRTFRPQRHWAAGGMALVLVVLGALVATESVSRIVGEPLGILPVGLATEYTRTLAWGDPLTIAGAAVLIAFGLVLLAAALVPGRGHYLPLTTGETDLVVGLSRTGMSRALAAAASNVDGVSAVRATVRRRRATVVADTRIRQDPNLRTAVRAAAQQRHDELDPVRPVKIRARVRFGRG